MDLYGDENDSALQQSRQLADMALDALGTLLRAYGKHAFDTDAEDAASLAHRCELWARHLLVGAIEGMPSKERGSALAERDWNGLRSFFSQQRRQEHAYVTTNFKNFREVVGTFVDALRTAFADDEADDAQVLALLSSLRSALETPSTERLREEVLTALSKIGQIVEGRAKRHRTQMEQLGSRLKELRGELNEARKEMALDPLTRLYNRSALDQHLARTRELSMLSGQPACLMMIDADSFKDINDRLGHPVGDMLLKELADCCARQFPRRNDFVARYGGDEFSIVLQDTTLEVARSLGGRLLDAIRGVRLIHKGERLGLTVSIGVAELACGEDATAWAARADQALYHAKAGGRNQVAESTPAAELSR